MGFDKKLLLQVAEYCFKTSIRTLEGMDKSIAKFFKLGLLSTSAFEEYMSEIVRKDEKIQDILDSLDIKRTVNYIDRENYTTWTESWKTPSELIQYATILAKGKESPLKYLSRILADWHEKGIKTKADAEKTTPLSKVESQTLQKQNFKGRSYSSNEINALFQSIDDIEV